MDSNALYASVIEKSSTHIVLQAEVGSEKASWLLVGCTLFIYQGNNKNRDWFSCLNIDYFHAR